MGRKPIDLTNQKFGQLTVMRKMFEDVSKELTKAVEAFETLNNVRQMPDHEVTTPNNEEQ